MPRWLKWVLFSLAAIVLLPVLALVIAFVTWPYRSERILGYRVEVRLPPDFSGCAHLIFNSRGAPATHSEGALYVVDLPAAGTFRTSTDLLWGETLRIYFVSRTVDGFKRVLPDKEGGYTTTYPDGSVEALVNCFTQPLKFDTQ